MFLECTKRGENNCIFAVEFNDKGRIDVSGSKRHVVISSDSYEGGKLAGEAAVDSWGSKALKQKLIILSKSNTRYSRVISV